MKLGWKKLGLGLLGVTGALVLGVVAFAGYGILTADAKLTFKDTPYPKLELSQDPDVLERGRYLAHGPAHCVQCHGHDERGKPEANRDPKLALSGGLLFDLGPLGKTYAANLTPDTETGIAHRTPREVARAIRTGVMCDGRLSVIMRIAAADLSDEDLAAVVSYLFAQPGARKAVPHGEWTAVAKSVLPLFHLAPRSTPVPRGVPAAPEPSSERGEYLAEHVSQCVQCHTASDPMTFQPMGPKAGGSLPDQSHGTDPNMEFVAPNLTADPRTGRSGQLTEDEFLARIRKGRLYASSIMPWESFSANMTDADVRSIYRYLRTLPTVHNEVGPTYRERGYKRAP
jgi:mono/diheme cytochrome c family protein